MRTNEKNKGKNKGKRDRPLYLFCGRHEGGHGEKQRLLLIPSTKLFALPPLLPSLPLPPPPWFCEYLNN